MRRLLLLAALVAALLVPRTGYENLAQVPVGSPPATTGFLLIQTGSKLLIQTGSAFLIQGTGNPTALNGWSFTSGGCTTCGPITLPSTTTPPNEEFLEVASDGDPSSVAMTGYSCSSIVSISSGRDQIFRCTYSSGGGATSLTITNGSSATLVAVGTEVNRPVGMSGGYEQPTVANYNTLGTTTFNPTCTLAGNTTVANDLLLSMALISGAASSATGASETGGGTGSWNTVYPITNGVAFVAAQQQTVVSGSPLAAQTTFTGGTGTPSPSCAVVAIEP